MLWRSSLLLFLSLSAHGQTAITALSAYWAMDVSDADRIMWDSNGTRHGMFTGQGFQAQTTIFSNGISQDATKIGGVSVPADLVNTSGPFAFGVWCRPNGSSTLVSRDWTSGHLWSSFFSGTSNGRLQWGGRIMPNGAYNKNAGDLALIWFAFDGTNTMVAVDNSSWTSGTAPVGFTNNSSTVTLDFAQNQRQFGRGATVGVTMFWDGYIPTDAERAAIWNGGSGRTYTYFNPSGYTAPPKPFTATLANASFARDVDLAQPGLYWLRPYPLKFMNPALAASLGDYMWLRSTDHSVGAGGVWIGYSASPATLPSSWTQIITDAAVSAASGQTWLQCETPWPVWNPDTSLFHLYYHCINLAQPTKQATHVSTSPDLSTWTWRQVALPFGGTIGSTAIGHTGYATVYRQSAGSWIAASLLTGGAVGEFGMWAGTDGLSFTPQSVNTCPSSNPCVPYYPPTYEYGYPPRDYGITGLGGTTNAAYVAYDYTVKSYPRWLLFTHPGTLVGGDWLQDVQAYEEGSNVWIYAKWSYQEPSTIRLFTGTLSGQSTPRSIFSGPITISGKVTVQ